MSAQKVGSVKIPMFDKNNYDLWKKKMTLFLRVANPKYLNVLKTGPIIPMITELESIVDGVTLPARMYEKDPKTYTADEKEDASLDNSLQLILVDSLDSVMHTHVVNCKDAKHIWETIEIINEESWRSLRLKTFVLERGLRPDETDGEMLEMIRERQWEPICATPFDVPAEIVREFYANLEYSGKSWYDTDSENEKVGNLALVANEETRYGPNSTVKFTDAELIRNLGCTLDCARRENDRIILQNTNLEKENVELKSVHINQDELRESNIS